MSGQHKEFIDVKIRRRIRGVCTSMAQEILCFSSVFLVLNLAVAAFSSIEFSRDDFPQDFIFGSGTSAYQVEGAAFQDGRTPSIWDTFTHSGKAHGDTGDIACDQYHKYKEDVKLMVETGLEAYRFSISWSRLIPNGRGPINPKGLSYYNNLINELISHGIQPHVTLFHGDMPQALEDEYEGWLSRRIVKDFTEYADVCFREFGDRVLHWTTINEGNIMAQGGYDVGIVPPQRCSPPIGNCSKGNSSTEPYIAGHHMLLAHASAVQLYREKYQDIQHGLIGANVYAFWLVSLTNKTEDIVATQRAIDFYLGWFVDVLVYGHYPDIVKKRVGARLPSFSEEESKQVKGSFDFIGINHYFSSYIKNNPTKLNMDHRNYGADVAVDLIPIIDFTTSDQYPILSWGLQQLLEYFKQVYGNPPTYIHENGQQTNHRTALNDTGRVEYLQGYIGAVLSAVRNGSNVKGYFTWSFLDLLELFSGYESSFGLYYVDFDDPELKRYAKLSAHWYSGFLKGENVSSEVGTEIEKKQTPVSTARSAQ